jgi:hypothetical protein
MAIKDLTVTKANNLIEARYKLDVIEQKVVLGCIAFIDPRKAGVCHSHCRAVYADLWR